MTAKVKNLIENNPIAVATIKGDKPNIVVIACAKLVSDRQILITDNYMNQTLADINTNNNVCLAVWDEAWSGLKIIGTAEYFSQGEWLDRVKKLEENKGLPAKGAILVSIHQIIDLK